MQLLALLPWMAVQSGPAPNGMGGPWGVLGGHNASIFCFPIQFPPLAHRVDHMLRCQIAARRDARLAGGAPYAGPHLWHLAAAAWQAGAARSHIPPCLQAASLCRPCQRCCRAVQWVPKSMQSAAAPPGRPLGARARPPGGLPHPRRRRPACCTEERGGEVQPASAWHARQLSGSVPACAACEAPSRSCMRSGPKVARARALAHRSLAALTMAQPSYLVRSPRRSTNPAGTRSSSEQRSRNISTPGHGAHAGAASHSGRA